MNKTERIPIFVVRMKKLLSFLLFALLAWTANAASPVKVAGKVVEAGSGNPVAGAVVRLDENYLWAVTGADGTFLLARVQPGRYRLEVSCLGYVTCQKKMDVRGNIEGLTVELALNSLALEEVVVTAEPSRDNLNTTQTIGRTALDHLQMNSMGGIAALLPGGKTLNPDLTTNPVLSLRSGTSTAGNAAFSTAIEIDGVRMGDNASFGGLSGTDTRSLSVENIESVEVITGVPSASPVFAAASAVTVPPASQLSMIGGKI